MPSFAKMAEAYQILSDPVKRRTYDMLQGFRKANRDGEDYGELMAEKRRRAADEIENMIVSVEQSKAVEQERNGLIIISAVYGQMGGAVDSLSTLDDQADEFGKTLDVSDPLQCKVEFSELRLEGGKPKFWLPGFYDPCPQEEKQLCVRYMFRGRLHEITVGDTDGLKIPMRSHLLGGGITFGRHDGKAAKSKRRRRRRSSVGGKFECGSLHYTQILEKRRARKRRNVLLVVAGAAGIVVWLKRRALVDAVRGWWSGAGTSGECGGDRGGVADEGAQ